MKKLALYTLCALLPLVLMIGCDEESNSNPPLTGTLNGTVVFHGDWPDSGTVQLSIFTNWNNEGTGCWWCAQSAGGPPAYHTAAAYFQDPDPANQHDADTLSFELDGISLGEYEVVVAGWRAPTPIGNIECDEPVIGMYGADPSTTDTIPSSITFTEGNATQNIVLHAYFNRIPDCGPVTSGTISGVVRADNDWPSGGLLAMITTFPVSGWNPVMGAPTDYFHMPTANDTTFEFDVGLGGYYVSIWTNAQPPASVLWFGSYGLNPEQYDARPDIITITEDAPDVSDLVVNVNVPAPHYIAGHINFTGTRPAEGLLVILTAFPYSPEHMSIQAPSGYFAITDPIETLYALNNIPAGTYYLSLWNYVQGLGEPVFYGAYGYTAGSDTDPDPVTLTEISTSWGATGIDITGFAP
jgi:hypothetical protein